MRENQGNKGDGRQNKACGDRKIWSCSFRGLHLDWEVPGGASHCRQDIYRGLKLLVAMFSAVLYFSIAVLYDTYIL